MSGNKTRLLVSADIKVPYARLKHIRSPRVKSVCASATPAANANTILKISLFIFYRR